MSRRGLRPDEQRTLALLGLPTAALALAITVVTTYLPVAARPMPRGRHGALTGFYSLSRGVGAALGPLVAGLVIQLLGHAAGCSAPRRATPRCGSCTARPSC